MTELRCIFLFILMASAIVEVVVGDASSETDQTNTDKINYECFENNTVWIDLDNKTTYALYAVGLYTIDTENSKVVFGGKSDANCTSPLSNITETSIELQDCTDNPVYVYFMKDTHSDILGGRNFHEYRLNCTLPEDGLKGRATYTAKPEYTADQVVQQNQNFTFVTLLMELSKKTVKIADLLTVTIKKKDSSAVPGFVLPTECRATNNKIDTDYKAIDLLQKGKALDEDVMSNFTIHDEKTATATLYAFRFVNSDTVVLTCNATVCDTKWCNDDLNTVYGTKPTSTGRRRRSLGNDEYGQKFQVSATMKITDQVTDIETSGQQCAHFNQLTVVPFILAIASTKLRLW